MFRRVAQCSGSSSAPKPSVHSKVTLRARVPTVSQPLNDVGLRRRDDGRLNQRAERPQSDLQRLPHRFEAQAGSILHYEDNLGASLAMVVHKWSNRVPSWKIADPDSKPRSRTGSYGPRPAPTLTGGVLTFEVSPLLGHEGLGECRI